MFSLATGQPFAAQLADTTSRPTAYLISVTLYTLGFIIIASANGVSAIAAGQLPLTFIITVLEHLHKKFVHPSRDPDQCHWKHGIGLGHLDARRRYQSARMEVCCPHATIEGRSLIVPQRFRHLPSFSSVYHQLLHRVSTILMQFYWKLFELTYVSYAEASSQMV